MIFKRFVSFLIAGIILFAESGQVIYAHTCFKSNETSFSLYTPAHCHDEQATKSCCEKKEAKAKDNCLTGKMSCCAVSAKYVQQSFPSDEIGLKKTIASQPGLLAIEGIKPYASIQSVVPICCGNYYPPTVKHSSSYLCLYRC